MARHLFSKTLHVHIYRRILRQSPASHSLRHCRCFPFDTEPRCSLACMNWRRRPTSSLCWCRCGYAAVLQPNPQPASARRQDAALPFIHGLRVPADIIFIVAEAAWNLAEEHGTVLVEYADRLRKGYAWCPLSLNHVRARTTCWMQRRALQQTTSRHDRRRPNGADANRQRPAPLIIAPTTRATCRSRRVRGSGGFPNGLDGPKHVSRRSSPAPCC